MKAFQDNYPDSLAHCYGCGANNPAGHHFRTFWEGDGTITRFTPQSQHTAIPGFVYGGLIASLIDCHSTGSASAAAAREQGVELTPETTPRFVTASLRVDYIRPTPMGKELVVRGVFEEVKEKKVVVVSEMTVDGELCATGRVVCVKLPENWGS